MDWITALGVVGSVFSIVSFFISIGQSSNPNNTNCNNRNSNNTYNLDSNNTYSVNSNNTYNEIHNEIINCPTMYAGDRQEKQEDTSKYGERRYKNTSGEGDGILFLIVGIVILGVILAFFIKHMNEIVIATMVIGMIGLAVQTLCICLLSRQEEITKKYIAFNTLKWIPAFLLLIFIYHPLFSTPDLKYVTLQLQDSQKILGLMWNYPKEVFFYALQFIAILMELSIILYCSISMAYRMIKYYRQGDCNFIYKEIDSNEVIKYVVVYVFVFIFISGIYINLFNPGGDNWNIEDFMIQSVK